MSKPLTNWRLVKIFKWECEGCDEPKGIEKTFICGCCERRFCMACELPNTQLQNKEYGDWQWICHECQLKNSGYNSVAAALNKGLESAKKTVKNFNEVFKDRGPY